MKNPKCQETHEIQRNSKPLTKTKETRLQQDTWTNAIATELEQEAQANINL